MKDYVYKDMLIKRIDSGWVICDEHGVFFGIAFSIKEAKKMIHEFRWAGNKSTKIRRQDSK